MQNALKALSGLILCFISIYYFLYPTVTVFNQVREESSAQPGVSDFAADIHLSISEPFGAWARDRVETARGTELSLGDISGTEWPMFSAVYFLWSTEELDKAWVAAGGKGNPKPSLYAADAIEAAADLVVDPANASWVIRHWGESYLERENIFYRMLLIAGLTSYQSITGKDRYEPLLRQQVISLSREFDQSPHGLLDDYPGQCYPIDILPAIAVMQRAAALLEIDLGDFAEHARRGFEGRMLDPATQLPSYVADPLEGIGIGPARGVGISYKLIWAKELWPETARSWYRLYQRQFVQQDTFISGVREFRKGMDAYSWLGDVDSGPILGGFGVAASAFGIAAARVNGDVELAHTLSTQAMLAAWPLPSGRLLIPSLLSDLSDAPFLGETALMFVFSRPMNLPHAPAELATSELAPTELTPAELAMAELTTPKLVYILLAVTLLLGVLVLVMGLRLILSAGRKRR